MKREFGTGSSSGSGTLTLNPIYHPRGYRVLSVSYQPASAAPTLTVVSSLAGTLTAMQSWQYQGIGGSWTQVYAWLSPGGVETVTATTVNPSSTIQAMGVAVDQNVIDLTAYDNVHLPPGQIIVSAGISVLPGQLVVSVASGLETTPATLSTPQLALPTAGNLLIIGGLWVPVQLGTEAFSGLGTVTIDWNFSAGVQTVADAYLLIFKGTRFLLETGDGFILTETDFWILQE